MHVLEINDHIQYKYVSIPTNHHHSAGVGRSGTVLTIDHCLQELRNKSVVNICGFVQKMRQQRNYMVQTDQQYTFIHYALLEAITYGDTSYEVNKFMGLYTEMQRQDGGTKDGQFLLEEEFQRLGMMKTMVKKSSFQNRIKVKGAPQRHFHSSCECHCIIIYCIEECYFDGFNIHDFSYFKGGLHLKPTKL